MDDDILIRELDENAGWESARQMQEQLTGVLKQRETQIMVAAYAQPKLDCFNRIGRILVSGDSDESQLEQIRDIVKGANQRCEAIGRGQQTVRGAG